MSKHEAYIKREYSELANQYESRWDLFLKVGRRWAYSALKGRLAQNKVLKILDIGCGNGVFLKTLHEEFPQHHYTGIDISKEMLPDKSKDIQFLNMSYDDYIKQDHKKRFDTILHMNVLHHIEGQEDHLKDVFKHMDEGAQLLLIDFDRSSLLMYWADLYWRVFKKTHVKSWSLRDLKAFINKQNGFEISVAETLKVNRFWRLQCLLIRKI
ncbi:MAG: hypothetical protein CMP22_06700 [Rickettsiales bacterium]|nr:hypothetical protein [Rickettsiales bacterium]|tara:strand:- start:4857 stop:5489 length:633 start_codon:yes stop_codon:yes gene_type:complete